MLFVFNFGECAFTSYEIAKNGLSELGSTSYFIPVISFFLVGQTMAFGFVTIERIQILSGKLTSANAIVRNTDRKRHRQSKLNLAILLSVVLDALLSYLIQHPQYLVASFMALDVLLYAFLLAKVMKLRDLIKNATPDTGVCKKAILYISVLFIGFLVEFVMFFIQGIYFRKQFVYHCPPILTIEALAIMYLFGLRFIWEPVSYFVFNALPRQLFIEACLRLSPTNRFSESPNDIRFNSMAVIPYTQ